MNLKKAWKAGELLKKEKKKTYPNLREKFLKDEKEKKEK